VEAKYLDPHHVGQSDEDYSTGFEPTSLDAPRRPTAEDSHRFYLGLLDMLERRVNLIFDRADPAKRRLVGPVYDPAQGSSGDGWPCTRCRRVVPTHLRLCPSCGLVR
jgi:hypothetical protein